MTEDVPVDASEGQALRFKVTEGLLVGDKTVIAKGATVMGAVMGESGKKRFLGIGGHKLTFRLTQAEAVDGRKIAVRAIAGKSEDGLATRSFETSKGSKSKGYAAMQGASTSPTSMAIKSWLFAGKFNFLFRQNEYFA